MKEELFTLVIFDDKNALRCNLRASIFQNFPGGACPQTPLEGACYAC